MKASEIDWSKAPEGATHWEEKSCRWIRIAGGVIFGAQFCRSHSWDRIAIPLNHELVERPAEPGEWNGTGLPPVGTVCEMCDDEGAWHRSTVIANGVDRGVPTAIGQADDTLLWCQADHHCRPVRTPEQIAAEGSCWLYSSAKQHRHKSI